MCATYTHPYLPTHSKLINITMNRNATALFVPFGKVLLRHFMKGYTSYTKTQTRMELVWGGARCVAHKFVYRSRLLLMIGFFTQEQDKPGREGHHNKEAAQVNP